MVLRRLLILIMFALTACATTGQETNVQKAEAHYKLGIAYLKQDKVQQAFVEFHKAYALDASNKEVLYAIGTIHLLNFNEPRESIDFFQKTAVIDPTYSEAYNSIGVAHEKIGRFEEAIPFYRKALSNLTYLTPEKPYINMGNAYYRLGKYEQAITSYKDALKRNPNLNLAYMRMALCYNAMGRYGEAASAMNHAIAQDAVFKGDKDKIIEDLTMRKLKATGYEEKDIQDYLEILKY